MTVYVVTDVHRFPGCVAVYTNVKEALYEARLHLLETGERIKTTKETNHYNKEQTVMRCYESGRLTGVAIIEECEVDEFCKLKK